jgi:hypothetical protein
MPEMQEPQGQTADFLLSGGDIQEKLTGLMDREIPLAQKWKGVSGREVKEGLIC